MLFKGKIYNPGSRNEIEKEDSIASVKFSVHKFNNRPRPAKRNRIAVFSCFSEFGSEIVGCLYCLPELLNNKYLGYYSIAIGWRGRSFLYKHLVDEFWELEESYQYLRDYCRAFHHDSKNLRRIEKTIHRKCGILVSANEQSKIALGKIFPNVNNIKKYACYPTINNFTKLNEISSFIKPKMVGITARNRRCYGRNLDVSFYERLVEQLKDLGYHPVWLGEKATSHPCPAGITNFMDSEHALDLEKTLLLVSKMEFTIQFYTASSRLAALAGTPYILVESPDQLFSGGQEGIRLELCTKGNKKLIISHFKDISENYDKGLGLVNKAILEIQQDNYDDIVIGNLDAIEFMKQQRRY